MGRSLEVRERFRALPQVVSLTCGSPTDPLARAVCGPGSAAIRSSSRRHYALPNLVPLLAQSTRFDPLREIMAMPLPQRGEETGRVMMHGIRPDRARFHRKADLAGVPE